MQAIRGVSLRPVAVDDMPFLFELFCNSDLSHLWLRSRAAFDEMQFAAAWDQWNTTEIAGKFIIDYCGAPAGLVFDYRRSLADSQTSITAVLHESMLGRGTGVVAAAMFVRWLFRTLPLRKVILEVYEFNEQVLAMLRKLSIYEEARIPQDRFLDGCYWNRHLFGLYADDWPAIESKIIRERGHPWLPVTLPAQSRPANRRRQ